MEKLRIEFLNLIAIQLIFDAPYLFSSSCNSLAYTSMSESTSPP